jgi:hypothetical protein
MCSGFMFELIDFNKIKNFSCIFEIHPFVLHNHKNLYIEVVVSVSIYNSLGLTSLLSKRILYSITSISK